MNALTEKRTSLEKPKLIYSIMDKPLCQASAVDSKAVNMRVDKAMILRNTGQELLIRPSNSFKRRILRRGPGNRP